MTHLIFNLFVIYFLFSPCFFFSHYRFRLFGISCIYVRISITCETEGYRFQDEKREEKKIIGSRLSCAKSSFTFTVTATAAGVIFCFFLFSFSFLMAVYFIQFSLFLFFSVFHEMEKEGDLIVGIKKILSHL